MKGIFGLRALQATSQPTHKGEELVSASVIFSKRATLLAPFGLLFCMLALQFEAEAQVTWLSGNTYDFGEIPAGKPVAVAFEFKNEGKTPLTIETTRTTCGCTAANYQETPIQPGQTGRITVNFDGQVPLGNRFKKKVKVYFRERKKGEVLVIKGSVSG